MYLRASFASWSSVDCLGRIVVQLMLGEIEVNSCFKTDCSCLLLSTLHLGGLAAAS